MYFVSKTRGMSMLDWMSDGESVELELPVSVCVCVS